MINNSLKNPKESKLKFSLNILIPISVNYNMINLVLIFLKTEQKILC